MTLPTRRPCGRHERSRWRRLEPWSAGKRAIALELRPCDPARLGHGAPARTDDDRVPLCHLRALAWHIGAGRQLWVPAIGISHRANAGADAGGRRSWRCSFLPATIAVYGARRDQRVAAPRNHRILLGRQRNRCPLDLLVAFEHLPRLALTVG